MTRTVSAKRKTRSTVVDLDRFGALNTACFDLQRYDAGGRATVVRIRLGSPSNAEWVATMALDWLAQRRVETERAFTGIADRLKAAKGSP